MNETKLRRVPLWRDVMREQIRIVGHGLRREALVTAVVIGVVTVVIMIDIVSGNAESWFDSDDWAPLGIAAFLLPFAVWWREKPFGPSFLWTLPVDRRRLALTRVLAGWVWLIAALAAVFLWQAALAAVSTVEGALTLPLSSFIGVTATYLFGSALVLGLRHPLRWLLGTVAVVGLLNQFFESRLDAGGTLRSSILLSPAIRTAGELWQSLTDPAHWAIATILSIGAGLAALWAAASRHAERPN